MRQPLLTAAYVSLFAMTLLIKMESSLAGEDESWLSAAQGKHPPTNNHSLINGKPFPSPVFNGASVL